jgi:hypothetical protein
MPLVVLGAILIVVGVALASVRTAQRGRSLKADLPGLGLIALGALLMVAGLLA